MPNNVLVLCPYGADIGLISHAQKISHSPVQVLVPQYDVQLSADYGASIIRAIPDCPTNETAFSIWLKDNIPQWNCNVILAPANVQMRAIMPMLAWHLKAGLTADCTDLSFDGAYLLQTRPAFGNSLMATIRTSSPIQMATVRTGTFQPHKKTKHDFEIIHESLPRPVLLSNTIEFQGYESGKPLSHSDIIIAGGAGIGSKEGFQKLQILATKLGAGLAASRNAVDAGYAPYQCQVGMTGITVCPKLYIAIGISGAVQHLSGMSSSEKIIAINSDPKAPIFDYADYGIVGDWESAIDTLLEELT